MNNAERTAGRRSRRSVVAAMSVLLFIAVPAAAALFGDPFAVSIATQIVIYALAAVSLDLILGYGGMVSFGHAAYFGIGAYAVAIAAAAGIDQALITWPLAIASAALLGLGIGALSVRTSGIFFIMITLAFAQMVFYLIIGLKTFGGDDGLSMTARNVLPFVDLRNPTLYYYVCLIALLAYTYLCARIVDSRFGMVLRGTRKNERRLVALGYQVYRYKLVAFVISAAGAGLAGALFANNARIASPDLASWPTSGNVMMMVILGGVGTLFGPMFGAAAFVGLQTWLAGLTEHWALPLGMFVIAVVLFANRGLFGVIAGRDE